jgi:hypothetical protein
MLTTNKIPRSSVIDLMISKNAKLDRSQLEKLTDDALVKQARADVPELSSLSVDMLQGVREFPLNPNFGRQSRVARPEGLENILEEAVRSSAPYSKGSSDQAMLVSYPSNDLINKHHDVVIRNLFTPERFTKRERFPRLMRVVRKTRDLLWR